MNNSTYSLSKRLISAFLDFVLFIIVFFVLQNFVGTAILNNATKYPESYQQFVDFQIDTRLYVKEENVIKIIYNKTFSEGEDKYSYYDDNLTYFYKNYVEATDEYPNPVDRLTDAKENSDYFVEQDGTFVFASETTEEQKNSFYKLQIDSANNLLYNNKDFVKIANKVSSYVLGNLFICLFVSALLFYLILPLVFKNGQTLGKKLFTLGLVSKNDHPLKFYQVLVRFLTFFFIEIVLGLITSGITLIISFAILCFTKEQTALHDYMASTRVVDLKLLAVEEENFQEEVLVNEETIQKNNDEVIDMTSEEPEKVEVDVEDIK